MNTPYTRALLLLLISLLIPAVGLSENASFEQRQLTIPAVNTPSQVAQYQDVVFDYSPENGWQLREFIQLGDGLNLAYIDEVEVVVTDTFPTQVLLRIFGYAPSACSTELGRFTHRLDGNHFTVTVNTRSIPRDVTQMCIAAALLFRKTIALPVYGLAAGTYTYDVNGLTGSFELTEDNQLAGDCEPSTGCPVW